MNIWAIADIHLAIGDPAKSMEYFGDSWKNYQERIKTNWENVVLKDDIVLIAGDISWAMHLEQALLDLKWIDSLPGKKVLIKGNHDYWWSSLKKVRNNLPPSIFIIQNDAISFDRVTIGGARLWDSQEYSFNDCVDYHPDTASTKPKMSLEDSEKIFKRELIRLEMSLSKLSNQADLRIAMTHYPPISADLMPSLASELLEKHRVNICVFGHLHNVIKQKPLFGEKNHIQYLLTSCDYIDFAPILISNQ